MSFHKQVNVFLNDSDSCFSEYGQQEVTAARLLTPFFAKVKERLLHGLPEPLPELGRVQPEESSVERTDHLLVRGRHRAK